MGKFLAKKTTENPLKIDWVSSKRKKENIHKGFYDTNDGYLGEFEVVCCGLRAQRYIVHSHGDRKSVFD